MIQAIQAIQAIHTSSLIPFVRLWIDVVMFYDVIQPRFLVINVKLYKYIYLLEDKNLLFLFYIYEILLEAVTNLMSAFHILCIVHVYTPLEINFF
ncbi:hypothetical protein C3744_02725 [Priestia megaterium]|uniref:Uncharacterized protein n=1 Tax=Priestia megaterium TaxID=1404 RepID=A0A3D8X7Q4_PRIMG|nr:hypothetical protein C3744_02725 [Priestia megaterium]